MADSLVKELLKIGEGFRDAVDVLSFQAPVAWTYNPLAYAWKPHREYLTRYARSTCEVVFLGMNPGPFGMAQTGVPFGEIAAVRDWLGIEEDVSHPAKEHPKRPIEGFRCDKSEVSGRRLWGLFADRYGTADRFFEKHFVANYCPLVFMEEGGKNITPDKINKGDAKELESVCDNHLQELLRLLQPSHVVGVGGYAEGCLQRVLGKETTISIGRILHPSPASPAANKDWPGQATAQLIRQGIWVP